MSSSRRPSQTHCYSHTPLADNGYMRDSSRAAGDEECGELGDRQNVGEEDVLCYTCVPHNATLDDIDITIEEGTES